MSEYREKRTIVQDVPLGRRPVAETRYDSVVNEPRGMSGVAVAALVVAGITAAVVITMMIINGQQKSTDDQLAQERAKTAAAQQTPAQQPVTVNVPTSQPNTVAVPYPVPGPSQPAPIEAKAAPSSTSIEADVNSRLQNDEELRSYAIDVKVSGGTATLSGQLPDEHLKMRAERKTGAVTGVQSVTNNITLRP
jgi:hypothetical protein